MFTLNCFYLQSFDILPSKSCKVYSRDSENPQSTFLKVKVKVLCLVLHDIEDNPRQKVIFWFF